MGGHGARDSGAARGANPRAAGDARLRRPTAVRRIPRGLAEQPERRRDRRRGYRDALPAPGVQAGVRRAVRGLRLRRPQPHIARHAGRDRRAPRPRAGEGNRRAGTVLPRRPHPRGGRDDGGGQAADNRGAVRALPHEGAAGHGGESGHRLYARSSGGLHHPQRGGRPERGVRRVARRRGRPRHRPVRRDGDVHNPADAERACRARSAAAQIRGRGDSRQRYNAAGVLHLDGKRRSGVSRRRRSRGLPAVRRRRFDGHVPSV